jgi:hypothetical protein
MDSDVLSLEIANTLLKLAPSDEEVEMLNGYTADVDTLGRVEQFLLQLMSVTDFASRLRCLICEARFEDNLDSIAERLTTLQTAIQELEDSVWFRRLLELVLGIGNYLNGGTPRGRAHGFKLDSLVKLATIKSVDSKNTLIHYLAELVNNREAELLDVGEELTHSKQAMRVSGSQLNADMRELVKGVKLVEEQLKTQAKKEQKRAGDYSHQPTLLSTHPLPTHLSPPTSLTSTTPPHNTLTPLCR